MRRSASFSNPRRISISTDGVTLKLFINFLEWSPLLALYIFISILVISLRGVNHDVGHIDVQNIVAIALYVKVTIAEYLHRH